MQKKEDLLLFAESKLIWWFQKIYLCDMANIPMYTSVLLCCALFAIFLHVLLPLFSFSSLSSASLAEMNNFHSCRHLPVQSSCVCVWLKSIFLVISPRCTFTRLLTTEVYKNVELCLQEMLKLKHDVLISLAPRLICLLSAGASCRIWRRLSGFNFFIIRLCSEHSEHC